MTFTNQSQNQPGQHPKDNGDKRQDPTRREDQKPGEDDSHGKFQKGRDDKNERGEIDREKDKSRGGNKNPVE